MSDNLPTEAQSSSAVAQASHSNNSPPRPALNPPIPMNCRARLSQGLKNFDLWTAYRNETDIAHLHHGKFIRLQQDPFTNPSKLLLELHIVHRCMADAFVLLYEFIKDLKTSWKMGFPPALANDGDEIFEGVKKDLAAADDYLNQIHARFVEYIQTWEKKKEELIEQLTKNGAASFKRMMFKIDIDVTKAVTGIDLTWGMGPPKIGDYFDE